MEIGMYEKEVEDKEIREIAERILPDTSFGKIYRICEQYGEEEADCREYDVYKLVTPEGDRMLKKADKREVSNYEKYLKQKDFCVPEFYGRWDDGADIWIMLESIEGNDLRDMTDELAKAAAKSIVQIQNAFWNHPDRERFEVYLERISGDSPASRMSLKSAKPTGSFLKDRRPATEPCQTVISWSSM